jgi:4-diphosphocytidyl-2-C-methyl-D-erythritol kinase
MQYIEFNAPAKINIGLKILNKREDGFHNLQTLFYPILDLADKLIFSKSENFIFSCNDKTLPIDETNLVVKAKSLLEQFSQKKLKVSISLNKNIPSQAGLGGGSSDAAATLLALNKLFNLKLNMNELSKIALMLGSDVPFFLKIVPAIGLSRGEKLEIVNLEIPETILIVNPGINISTKEAFQNVAPNRTYINYNELIINGRLDYSVARETLSNDFESYVYTKHSEIKEIKSILYEMGADFSLMSGSGSSVFGIFHNNTDAIKAINKLPKHYFHFLSTRRN